MSEPEKIYSPESPKEWEFVAKPCPYQPTDTMLADCAEPPGALVERELLKMLDPEFIKCTVVIEPEEA